MMTRAQISMPVFRRGCLRTLVVGVILTGSHAVRANPQTAESQPDVFGSAMRDFVAAQQDALNSGDSDRILNSSSPVAVASLALLNSFGGQDQENQKALAYAQGLLSDPSSELMLLKMELSLGETASAAELRKHILSANSEDARLDLGLAEILEQELQFDEAIPEAQRAVDLDPTSRDAQIALGMGYWGANAFQYNEESRRAFTAAERIDPQGYAPNLLLGRIESQYHDFDAAAQYLRKAADSNPSATEPWYHLGMNAFEESRPAEASGFLEHYISLAGSGKDGKPAQVRLALLTLDEIAGEQGRAPEEGRLAEESALKQKLLQSQRAPESSSGTEPLPMGASETPDQPPMPDKPTSIGASAETIAQLRELAAGSLGNIGTVLARKQDFSGAVVPFRFAAEEYPTLEPLMRNYGLAACMSGMYEDSVRALRQIVSAHPDDSAAMGCLGIGEFETGAYSEAVTNFTSLGPALSSNPLFAATAAAAFARTGDRRRAEEALAGLKSVEPNPQEEAREATAYFDLGKLDRAIELAEAASSGSHVPGEALRVLGVIDLERGDASKAAVEFRNECNADQPGTEEEFEAEALLAKALGDSGKKAEGEELGMKVMQSVPELYKALVQEAGVLLKNGDTQADFQKSAAALALAPHAKDARAAFDAAKRAIHNATH
jgi:tetratricopeptide (TPR) repeat protein